MSQTIIGKTCPYCQTPIKPGAAVWECPACGIPHHRECWEANGGCTTYGCTGVATARTRQLAAQRHSLNRVNRLPEVIDLTDGDLDEPPRRAVRRGFVPEERFFYERPVSYKTPLYTKLKQYQKISCWVFAIIGGILGFISGVGFFTGAVLGGLVGYIMHYVIFLAMPTVSAFVAADIAGQAGGDVGAGIMIGIVVGMIAAIAIANVRVE